MIICCSFQGLEPADVQSHSNYLKGRYKHTRYVIEQEEWPPDQPKHFTSLALIHYRSGYTEREVIAFRKATQHAQIDDIMSPANSQNVSSGQSQEQVKKSKDIKDIFAPSGDGHEPHSILIEGAPGIGKTVLSKEISVQWANGQLLKSTKLLFLIILRDPLAQKIVSLKDLVKYYYQHEESSDTIASSCADYLLHSGGKDVVFVFDGYDECPKNLRQNGFIPDILQHKLLPHCHLVVTSRPSASACLRKNFHRYIEILGFTKEDRKKYIEDSVKEKQDVDKLVEYLDSHLTINSLCFIPFNMTVLLWLYNEKESILPTSSTELYKYFICHTIRHYLGKKGISLHDSFEDLNTLEAPYRQIIKQLSFLSYQALDKSQLTFTLDEIKTACPRIEEIPEALNGFGLLQAVVYFGIKKNTTLNFVHLSVQEFLAAYHITCLSHYEEFCALKEKFMSDFYVNTFTMYVGMTKGQRPAFKQYLNGSGNWTAYMYEIFGRFSPLNWYSTSIRINPELLVNERTCFRLFKCFHEAGDEALCIEISNNVHFSRKCVTVCKTLLPSDVECLGVFLCSRKEWKRLYLYQSIDDVGFQILYQLLTTKSKTTFIHELHIFNGEGEGDVSSRLITEIAKSCKTKVLEVRTPVLLLEDIVSLKNQLTELSFYVERDQTSIKTLIPLFIHNNKILEVLRLYYNDSIEYSVVALIRVLRCNYVLEETENLASTGHTVVYELKNKTGTFKISLITINSIHKVGTPTRVLKEVIDKVSCRKSQL